jgi:hypothetical protein
LIDWVPVESVPDGKNCAEVPGKTRALLYPVHCILSYRYSRFCFKSSFFRRSLVKFESFVMLLIENKVTTSAIMVENINAFITWHGSIINFF